MSATYVGPFNNTQSTAPPVSSYRDPYSLTLDELLRVACKRNASDLHLTEDLPPLMRTQGKLHRMPYPVLSSHHIQNLIYPLLTEKQITNFEEKLELDLSYNLPDISRFRINLFHQRGAIGAIIRLIPLVVPTIESLGLPKIVSELTTRRRGLVLVTGPTGEGKSTTLAAMIQEINMVRQAHIMTIEDPIEFVHEHQLSEINQRQIGNDTLGYSEALRHVLRQDPDVILIGEMRDLETIAAAITAAETGHLVLSSLHTTSAAQTVDRIIDVFPPYQQNQVRTQLANVLEGVITQVLLPAAEGDSRCCAMEILIATPAIRTLIRDCKIHQIPGVIEASSKQGMQTLDQSLLNLVRRRLVSYDEAVAVSTNQDDFKRLSAMKS
ncbi:MAG: type IV pilus twitching motility protein PilT [Armatimonadota bacterium]